MRRTVSLCTVCRGRLPHLRETLPRNLSDNEGAGVEFVVLGCGPDPEQAAFVRSLGARVSYYEILDSPHPLGGFFRAHAKNVCALLASGGVVCNVDADNFTGRGFAAAVAEMVHARHVMVRAEDGADTTGRIACTLGWFLRLGGYDERMRFGWGYEDHDLVARGCRRGAHVKWLGREYLGHIAHDDAGRTAGFAADKHESEATHRRLSEEALAGGVWRANAAGDWGVALVRDYATGACRPVSAHRRLALLG